MLLTIKDNYDRLPSPVIMRFDPGDLTDQQENETDSNDTANEKNVQPKKAFINKSLYYKEHKNIQTNLNDSNEKVLCDCDKMFAKLVSEKELKDLKLKISELEKDVEKKRKIV